MGGGTEDPNERPVALNSRDTQATEKRQPKKPAPFYGAGLALGYVG